MKRIIPIALSALLVILLTSCGYQGFYRYPCQNPDNWKNVECNPPVCEANGTCTKDVFGTGVITTTETGTNNG
jgi:hypothetical protein